MRSFVVALDVGGTSMKGALVDQVGTVLHTERRATPRAHGPEAVVKTIRAFITHLTRLGDTLPATPARGVQGGPNRPARSQEQSGLVGVGLIVPGIVTSDTAVYAANLGWRDVPAADFTTLDVPVMLGHDVRTGGLAECVLGAGRGSPDFLFLPIGTGIAAAMIINGEPYGGATGWGGEVGHIPVLPTGEACACGQIGCLETYASAASVGRRYSIRAGRPDTRAEQVVSLARAGDPIAVEVWNDAIEALSLGLASYTLLLDPILIVLGGGLAEAGPALTDPLRERLAKRLTFREAPPLRPAALGVNAGMLGAALLGWQAAGHPDIGHTWTVNVPETPPVP
ncbi:ROK family protein [Sinosporangium siamense]|uniref:Sugar kinase n=1 Tax=Sinosporangium siamense TaxID=1367973 RepID=A0A919V4C6_9ACTN|nr:ROK family protein [Sinosporangium siamense]GII91815.1 sugar kinase [Sinosporangium siamense]